MGVEGGGVVTFRGGRFNVYTTQNGLPDNYVKALLEDRAGALWIGTGSGLARFKDGVFTIYTVANGMGDNLVQALAEDKNGNLGGHWGRADIH